MFGFTIIFHNCSTEIVEFALCSDAQRASTAEPKTTAVE